MYSCEDAEVRILTILAVLCAASLAQSDARVPSEVRYKSGYVNHVPKPQDFTSAMLWGIAIADNRVQGYERAQVEIEHTKLTCRVDGKDVVMMNDAGDVRGGLYRRFPWFGTDEHEPLPVAYSSVHRAVILNVGRRLDRVWHFWAASPRSLLPPGHLDGCTVTIRAKVSKGALLQVGFDYWRNATVGYGSGANNLEAGASDWYFPSNKWQEAMFSDVKK